MENRLSLNDKTLSWIIVFLTINNLIAISLNLGNIYYGICGVVLFIIFSKNNKYIINKSMLCLYLLCAISILINDIPSLFKPWERLISFIIVTALVSPFIESNYLNRFRIRLFSSLLSLYQLVVIASIIVYFIGIRFSELAHFTGITKQSMLIAPVSAIVILYSVYSLSVKHKKNRLYICYHIVILIIAFLTLILSASRSAIIGAIVSIILYLVIIYRQKTHYFIKVSIGTIVILLFTFSLWSPYLENLEQKNASAQSAGSFTNTRDILWQTRIEEFKSSPLFGIGFSTVDIDREGSNYTKDGIIETGSSWLCILSMIGILGFISFLFIYGNSVKILIKSLNTSLKYGSFLLSLLCFWTIHMIAEGYIFASGSFLFFNVWLLLGYIHILGCNSHYIIALSK